MGMIKVVVVVVKVAVTIKSDNVGKVLAVYLEIMNLAITLIKGHFPHIRTHFIFPFPQHTYPQMSLTS